MTNARFFGVFQFSHRKLFQLSDWSTNDIIGAAITSLTPNPTSTPESGSNSNGAFGIGINNENN
ncbi:hypothetical protein G9A89_014322 [Geosiphon pyriformis]|nr:hypothetical protein G9A89_014322 [Geosiphon pyriformis]